MSVIFLRALQKIIVMFFFGAIGYVTRKTGLLPKEATKTLAVLGTYILYPAYLFNSLSESFRPAVLKGNMTLLYAGVLFLIVEVITAYAIAALFPGKLDAKGPLLYMLAFTNYGYFGYPLIGGVFGDAFVAKLVIFAVPTSVAIGSLGYYMVTGGKGREVLKNLLSSAMVWSILIGMIWGMLDIHTPAILSEAMSGLSGCLSPITMMLTGFVLGGGSFLRSFTAKKGYIISALRLLILPLFFGCIFYLLHMSAETVCMALLVGCMPIGMNTIMFAESAGRDSSAEARTCFLSYVFGLITLPVIFAVLETMFL